ncbi:MULTISPECIES: helix-turn-helix domain-containing protein [Nocardiopsidaceae]|uniref:Helix-turn-helix domain-containing protein n=1 Tax=Streptomonospora nanhaiensis TaxID=1323731 RepID=A0ABY6YHU7_9ACTN|nr:helix-turn-helix domain-containing protein [Streptomonospora nanhaiensis]WAE71845.1 helix-turn-helix domain-containing protein [Streptomonospora nanhaiensis]
MHDTPAPLDPRAQRAVVDLLARVESGDQLSAEDVRSLLGPVEEGVVVRAQRAAAGFGRLRRRDGELSALIASTRDLVEVRDVQALLRKLVDRAHDLVSTDVTYLSVYDESTDELFVRASRGTVSPRFQGLRVPAGMGIASRVVRTRSPQWTADYGAEHDLDRDPEIDAAVGEERLRSLLGVPMAANGEVLGVLFAADRSTRSFASDEIALLSAFADHAAVILHTARLFSAVTDAADRAEDAQSRAERHLEAMNASARVHERLTALVLSGHGPREVAATLAESLGRPVAIADRELRPVAATAEGGGRWWTRGRLSAPAVRAAERSRASGHCAPVGAEGLDVVAAAIAGSELLGLLLVGVGPAPLTDVERRTIERSGQIVALLTMQREALTDAEERVRGELALDLVSGSADMDALERRAAARGIVLDQPWSGVVVPVPDRARHPLLRALSAASRRWLVAAQGEGVAVLVPGGDPGEAARQVRRSRGAREEGPMLAVASRVSGPAGIGAALAEAWECAGLLPALGVSDGAHEADEYAPYLAMFGTDGARALAFVDRMIGPVVDWDREHRTELAATIAAYADGGGSVSRAARALYVHPNTVKQRLERVTALLGPDWRSPDPMFRVGVAARLHRLRTAGNRHVNAAPVV